jgi:hypothetical protein
MDPSGGSKSFSPGRSRPASSDKSRTFSPQRVDPDSFVLELDKHILNARQRAMNMIPVKRAFEDGLHKKPFASETLSATEQLLDLQQNLEDLSINKIRNRIGDILGALQRDSRTPQQPGPKGPSAVPSQNQADPVSKLIQKSPTPPLQVLDISQEKDLVSCQGATTPTEPIPQPTSKKVYPVDDDAEDSAKDQAKVAEEGKVTEVEKEGTVVDEGVQLETIKDSTEEEEEDGVGGGEEGNTGNPTVNDKGGNTLSEEDRKLQRYEQDKKEKDEKEKDDIEKAATEAEERKKKEEELRRMFDMFDEDGNGSLEVNELVYVYKFYGIKINETAILKQLQRAKAKNTKKKNIYSDTCDFEDFCRLCDSPILQRKMVAYGLQKDNTLSNVPPLDEDNNEIEDEKAGAAVPPKWVRVTKKLLYTWWRGELVFDPSHNIWVMWNLGTMLWVMQASLIIPCRMGFSTVPNTLTLCLDYLSEVWFLCDIFLSMHMGYTDSDNGEMVMEPTLVKRKYMRSWFILDTISSIPVTFLTLIISTMGNFGFLKIIRLLKIFRLLKMLKLKTLEDLEESGHINPSLLRFLKLLFTFLFLLHFVASGLWSVVTDTCVPCPATSMGLDGMVVDCLPGESMYPTFCPEDWRVEAMVSVETTLTSKYLFAFNWAILSMLGDNAYAASNQQYAFTIMMSILGVAIFSSIIGSLSSMMTSMDAIANSRKDQLDAIRIFLRFRKVDKSLAARIHGFYKYLWTSGQSKLHQAMFQELPLLLQSQLDIALKQDLILGVPMFRSLEKATIVALCTELHSASKWRAHSLLLRIQTLSQACCCCCCCCCCSKLCTIVAIPEQVLIGEGDPVLVMYFLSRGKVNIFLSSSKGTYTGQKMDPGQISTRDGRVLTKVTPLTNGAHFGEVALLEVITRGTDNFDDDDDGSKHTSGERGAEVHKHSSIIAEVYCELEELRLKDFHRLIKVYPDLELEMNLIVSKRQRRQKFLKIAVANVPGSGMTSKTLSSSKSRAPRAGELSFGMSGVVAAKILGAKAKLKRSGTNNKLKEMKLRKKSMMEGMNQAIFANATYEPPRSSKKLMTFSSGRNEARKKMIVANKRKNTVQQTINLDTQSRGHD